MQDYRGHPITRAALTLSALLFLRPGELRQLEWAWVNYDDSLITIPAALMKRSKTGKAAGPAHIVPLAPQAVRVLREVHATSIRELEDGLAPELREELQRLALPFSEDSVPSDAELRIAQAQLVGWLEGLFHGIQTALFAQQMAARAQLEHMRQGALPPGMLSPGDAGENAGGSSAHGTGQYL